MKILIELDKRLLVNYYKSLGYYDVNIVQILQKLKKEGNAELIYIIDEGKDIL